VALQVAGATTSTSDKKMWRYLILSILLCSYSFADSHWSAKTHEDKVIVLYSKTDKDNVAFSPDLKGLEALLSLQPNDAAFRHLCFWNYLENNPTIQRELLENFKAKYPDILQAAIDSAGNTHNPKVIPLSSVFSECLIATPSVQKIDALFRKRGYAIYTASHEKFRIEKASKSIEFKAITWLKITKTEQSLVTPYFKKIDNTDTVDQNIQSTKLNSLAKYKQEVMNEIQVKWNDINIKHVDLALVTEAIEVGFVIDKEGKISSVKIDEKAPAINKQIILMTLQQVKIPKLTNQILNEMNTEKLDFNMAFEN